MKYYYHPISTTSRPALLFIAESGADVALQNVDLFTGEHVQPAYTGVNPNQLVPVLEDGDFRLTESSAILKYLADKMNSPLYPKEPQARARVNERMDWISTQLSRDLCYGMVYPQIFPSHKRDDAKVQDAVLQRGREFAEKWLGVLNDNYLAGGNAFICGKDMTIADFYAASFVATAEVTGSDFAKYPNVRNWLSRMKKLKSWPKTYEVIDGFAASLKGTPMVSV